MIHFLAQTLFPFLLVLAGAYDFLTLRIPNWLTALVAVSFFPMALATGLPGEAYLWHIAAGAAMLVIGFGLFAFNLFGGGDAKLLAAAGLWFGWPESMPFVAYTVFAGGLLAAAIGIWSAVQMDREVRGHTWAARIFAAKPNVPYGVAIAAGVILALPGTWWLKPLGG
jgi:prepilin peptidase CpaA